MIDQVSWLCRCLLAGVYPLVIIHLIAVLLARKVSPFSMYLLLATIMLVSDRDDVDADKQLSLLSAR